MNKQLPTLFHAAKLLSAMFLFLLPISAVAQQGTLTGIVRDERGVPVSGASIVVKGTGIGTASAANGTFSIAVTPNAVLQVTAVGYETQEVTVGRQNAIDVNLKQSSQEMANVVVVA